jgi:hypothetical protein
LYVDSVGSLLNKPENECDLREQLALWRRFQLNWFGAFLVIAGRVIYSRADRIAAHPCCIEWLR